ncbi:ABC transporter permease [Planosporangium thailandense]|uniref:ABC transporter permease n=1 Tax=Planosporangium thailandense TaxID=765197 RepID=A0ABX0Y7H3_9ACTN|nr:ABC transporter permease [Planosporangium thailandense]NJC73239.1 ABC transporter permease [Planosporangium thailandense]
MPAALAFLLRRVAVAVVTVFVAVSANFFLFRAVPGDAASVVKVPGMTAEQRQQIRAEFGLDKPLPNQYLSYLRQLTHGNLGISFENRKPVAANLAEAVVNTMPMVVVGTLIALVIGFATGLFGAWRRGTAVDAAGLGTALAFYAMPAQWLALMLILLTNGLFPSGGMSDVFLVDADFWTMMRDRIAHLLLPALTFGLASYGQYAVIIRSSMLETLGEDYVLTARAKGFSNWAVVRRHALRNAMLPITTLIALSLGTLMAGAILIETVFSWPGVGLAIYGAVRARDYPMLQGAFLLLTCSVILCNLLADTLYLRLDPRIRTA